MPYPSASSNSFLNVFKNFWSCSIFLNVVKYFWPCSNMQNYKVKYHFWPCSKIFDQVQKILTKVKKFWTWSKYFWTSIWNRHKLENNPCTIVQKLHFWHYPSLCVCSEINKENVSTLSGPGDGRFYTLIRPFNLHLHFWKSRSWKIKVCFKP